jgi:hypothetical protein
MGRILPNLAGIRSESALEEWIDSRRRIGPRREIGQGSQARNDFRLGFTARASERFGGSRLELRFYAAFVNYSATAKEGNRTKLLEALVRNRLANRSRRKRHQSFPEAGSYGARSILDDRTSRLKTNPFHRGPDIGILEQP